MPTTDPRAAGRASTISARKGSPSVWRRAWAFMPGTAAIIRTTPSPPWRKPAKPSGTPGAGRCWPTPATGSPPSPPQELFRQLDALRELGVQGIECFYPANSLEMTRLCQGYCREHGMLITQGSDWHGAFCAQRHGIYYRMGEVRAPLGELTLGDLLLSSPPSKNL